MSAAARRGTRRHARRLIPFHGALTTETRQQNGLLMAEDLMHYEDMAREALRGVVREALHRAAADGLPGAHHFYISFPDQQRTTVQGEND